MCDLNIKISIVFILFFTSTLSIAEMYKWVDEDGNTHYSEKPPVADVEVETIAPPPPVDTNKAQQELQKTLEQANSLREGRVAANEEKQKEKNEAEQKKQQCQQLKEKLEVMEYRPRASKKDEDGNIVRLGEEERQKEIANTKKQISEKCN